MKNLMLKMMMSALVMSSSVLASDKTPGLTEHNPNHDFAGVAMNVGLTSGLIIGGKLSSTIATGDSFYALEEAASKGYISNAISNYAGSMSDQAWDLMRFYDHHNIDISDRDDLHMRVAGCIIQ